MSTLDYYNQNAELYTSGTINADVSVLYSHFEPYLPPHASIIDIGCGSGRDTKHFIEAGYAVTAIDGSQELCKQAASLTGVPVRCIMFSEIDYESMFDGAWACSSLLHVPKHEMESVFQKICRALKPNGVFYASYKYGETEREVGERHFSDYTEKDLPVLTGFARGLSVAEYWISADVRQGRSDEKWLNIIWRKQAP